MMNYLAHNLTDHIRMVSTFVVLWAAYIHDPSENERNEFEMNAELRRTREHFAAIGILMWERVGIDVTTVCADKAIPVPYLQCDCR